MKNIMADEDEDVQKLPNVNKSVYIPFKQGTLFGHLMMWDSIESDDAVALLFFEINLYSNPSEVSYWKSFSSSQKLLKSEVAKSLATVVFYDIILQQCYNTSLGKNTPLGFTVPRCASHRFAFS